MKKKLFIFSLLLFCILKIHGQYTKFQLDDNDWKKVVFSKDDTFFYSSKYFLKSIELNSRDHYTDELVKNSIEYKSYKDFAGNKTLLKIAYFNDKAEYSFLYFILSNINCENNTLNIDIAENINLKNGYKTLMDNPQNYFPSASNDIDRTLKSVILMRCKEAK